MSSPYARRAESPDNAAIPKRTQRSAYFLDALATPEPPDTEAAPAHWHDEGRADQIDGEGRWPARPGSKANGEGLGDTGKVFAGSLPADAAGGEGSGGRDEMSWRGSMTPHSAEGASREDKKEPSGGENAAFLQNPELRFGGLSLPLAKTGIILSEILGAPKGRRYYGKRR